MGTVKYPSEIYKLIQETAHKNDMSTADLMNELEDFSNNFNPKPIFELAENMANQSITRRR